MFSDILQPTHLLFVLVIALLVLGPKRLPEVGRSLGRGLRDFKTAVSGEDQDRPEELVHQPPAQSSEPVDEPQPDHTTETADKAQPSHTPDPAGESEPVREHAEHSS